MIIIIAIAMLPLYATLQILGQTHASDMLIEWWKNEIWAAPDEPAQGCKSETTCPGKPVDASAGNAHSAVAAGSTRPASPEAQHS
jgi:hypothetical protein